MTDPFDDMWESTHGDSNNGVDTEYEDGPDEVWCDDYSEESDPNQE